MDIARVLEVADKKSKAFKTPEPAIRKFSSHASKPREGNTVIDVAALTTLQPTANSRMQNATSTERQDETPTSDLDTSSGDEYHLQKLGEQSSNPIEVEVLYSE